MNRINKHTVADDQKIKLYLNISKLFFVLLICVLTNTACKKFVKVELPETIITNESVFQNDASAISAMSNVYHHLARSSDFASGGRSSISFLQGLSSDELDLYLNNNTEMQSFYLNNLTSANSIVLDFWGKIYSVIYKANVIIEGLTDATNVTTSTKIQLEGEAKFIRGFCHFYLVNLFGDIPYIKATDYRANSVVLRTPNPKLYQLIIDDLLSAQQLLKDNYPSAGRVRPNKWVATAMLARAYLYTGDWEKAEAQSSSIIANSDIYSLTNLENIFLKTSTEALWQLLPIAGSKNSFDGETFILTGIPQWASMSHNLFNAFEVGDMRKDKWVGTITVNGNIFNFPVKYMKMPADATDTENSMILRLSEQYLIRAEARAKQNNISGAIADLNVLRIRARGTPTASVPNPLPDLPTALTQMQVLAAIDQERRIELFTEWGHRWFDLKRTGRLNAVMSVLKPTSWQTTDALLPIPESEILRNKNLTQNAGY